jgi:hypothetical protein
MSAGSRKSLLRPCVSSLQPPSGFSWCSHEMFACEPAQAGDRNVLVFDPARPEDAVADADRDLNGLFWIEISRGEPMVLGDILANPRAFMATRSTPGSATPMHCRRWADCRARKRLVAQYRAQGPRAFQERPQHSAKRAGMLEEMRGRFRERPQSGRRNNHFGLGTGGPYGLEPKVWPRRLEPSSRNVGTPVRPAWVKPSHRIANGCGTELWDEKSSVPLNQLKTFDFSCWTGGAEGDRTPDLRNAIATLSQLSYGPTCRPPGWSGDG